MVKRLLKRTAENLWAPLLPWLWKARQEPRLLVLMYHRVLPRDGAERRIEQPGMVVAPETLDLHLTTLRRHFVLVHLDDWARDASRGAPLPRLACALTFDDGWRDNFEHAYPVLLRHQAPAMIFLVSALIGTDTEFWPNRLGRLLASTSPATALPGALGERIAPAQERARARGEYAQEEIDAAIVLAKELPEERIQAEIERLLGELGQPSAPRRTILNESELRTMAGSGLVRFGSHTRTHYRCREGAPRATLAREIVESRAEIAVRVGQDAPVFCYPNGDTSEPALAMVREHYVAAVTTEHGWHAANADRFEMRRIGVHDDVSDRKASFLCRIGM